MLIGTLPAVLIAALLLFASRVELLWLYGLLMAVCNVAGSLLGTRLALKRGGEIRSARVPCRCRNSHRRDGLGRSVRVGTPVRTSGLWHLG
jgi:hypothetical protein